MRLKWPKVTVVLTTYNRPDMLRQAIGTVMAQTFDDYELIVADDASGTAKGVCEDFTEWFDTHGISLRVIETEKNCGTPAACNNAAFNQARGSYIACADDDDLWEPHHLETLVNLIEESGADLVYSNWRFSNSGTEGPEDGTVHEYLPMQWRTKFLLTSGPHLNFISSHVLFSKAAVLGNLGSKPFNERLVKFEDWDFLVSCVNANLHIVGTPEVTFTYRWGHDQIQTRVGSDKRRKIRQEKMPQDWGPEAVAR